jgi:hypothetical protein
MLFDIEVPSLNERILNAALELLFYVCGHGFLFQSCSTGNPHYASEVWHQTPGTSCIALNRQVDYNIDIIYNIKGKVFPSTGLGGP